MCISSFLISEQIQSEWEGTQEMERILEGLKAISKPGVMEEAHMFIDPVDLEKVSDYCVAVAYPISLSIIIERLENRFYRYACRPICRILTGVGYIRCAFTAFSS